jgi:NAD(P)-dependent dehydrogenase (short-subunit alcohol dehydrogenase family)
MAETEAVRGEASGVRTGASFDGKAVFITGAASGIGLAAARALAREGARVALADRDAASVEAAAQTIVETGLQAIAMTGDVGDEASVDAMVAETVRRFGRIDCAFNNAGISQPALPAAELSVDDWDNVMRVNVRGVWLCMRAQIPHMLAAGGGVILNTASLSAHRAMSNLSAYTASKHAVLGLTRAAAREYASQAIRINALCPGAVHTQMTDRALALLAPADAEAEAKRRASLSSIGRMGTVDEMADVVCYLLGDRSSYIIGQGICADGGWNL